MKRANATREALSPARRAAFDVLMAVERGPGHSDDLLRGKAVEGLAHADRNLATALVLGVLRWQIWLDEETKKLLKRPEARLDAEVNVALRMGAFQLLFLDRVPAHAAIDESVELAKRAGHRFAARMVNAVLRKLAAFRAKDELPSGAKAQFDFAAATARLKPCPFKTEPDGFEDRPNPLISEEPSASDRRREPYATSSASAAKLALASAHPAWMVERWARSYGLDAARGICECGQRQPCAAVRLANAAVEAELAEAGVKLAPGELLGEARTVTAGDVTATAAFRDRRVRWQDEGSQLMGEIAACAGGSGGRSAERIVDLCAAPGGKTLILAERNPAARIVACDASAPRLAGLRERLAFVGERVEFRLADAAAFNEESAFDLALADAPCSGTGTLGRNPEIRHRLRPEDLARQAERQRAILRAGLRAVRPGGRVVYSTCSLEPEENEQVVSAVLAENAQACLVPMEKCIEALESRGILAAGAAERLRRCVTPEGALRLMPGLFGTDGFYVTLLERTG
ncbi:MAG TPA: transcription antitermination factor NusB [Terracidiphilus sp.]|nr:transcription antitermination factor NusB [Terracidiphilus sp.]